MSLPLQVERVRQQMASHLANFDWSNLTPGRKNILNTFLRLATTEGYAAVTMRSLGKALDIKAPSIYSHFPNGREEIVTSCLRWHYYNFGIEMLSAVGEAASAEEFLEQLIRIHVRLQLERPESDLWDILVASDRVGKFLQDEIRKEVSDWLSLCTELYEVTANEIYPNVTHRKALMVMTTLDQTTSWAEWAGTPKDILRICDQGVMLAQAIFSA